MGFGHRVYKDGDPRAVYLKKLTAAVAAETGNQDMEQMADIIEIDRLDREKDSAQRRLALRPAVSLLRPAGRSLHAAVRRGPRRRLVGPRHRAARQQPHHAPAVDL